jgi:hypothetical protein
MAKFRKKPVVIEAVQYTGENASEIDAFVGLELKKLLMHPLILVIPTLEGDHNAMHGDWIIKGIKGEFYPCKPDIFAATYEPFI